MSFSKAKIIRFNDVPNSPSPAKSNLPKDNAKDKPKKGSCSVGYRSPTLSDCGSARSVPVIFKTPTLPKKTKTVSSTVKPRELFHTDIEALKQKNEECQSKTSYIHKLTEELEVCKANLEQTKIENERLLREHQNEMQELEFEMLKTMTKLQKQEEEAEIKMGELEEKCEKTIENLKKTHEYKIGQIVLDYEIKMKEFKEASEDILKDKLDKLETEWREKLENKDAESEAILKECQAISEYNIIQCEIEKKIIQKSLDETRASYQKLQKKYEVLINNQEYLAREKELADKVKTMVKTIQDKEEEIRKLTIEVKSYQLTINNTQKTIEVLKRRLIDSDRDVEQLKIEVAKCEEQLLDYEARHYQLNAELKEARQINSDLELCYESAIKLNEQAINEVKEDLLSKVSNYKKQVKQYTQVEDKVIEQLNINKEVINNINLELDKTEEYYSVKLKNLEEVIDCYKEEEVQWQKKFKEQEAVVRNSESKLTEMDHLKEKCSYYKEKSEQYEAETKENCQTLKKYIDVSGKYDALLQTYETLELENKENKDKVIEVTEKLQRLLQLESEYEKLQKEKEKLQSENTLYKNKFEDQKVRRYKIAAQDKENIGSPNRSMIESPNRGSPFRERN